MRFATKRAELFIGGRKKKKKMALWYLPDIQMKIGNSELASLATVTWQGVAIVKLTFAYFSLCLYV